MAEGRGSSLLYSLRLISLGLRLTASLPGGLQSCRAGAGSSAPARPDHPRGAPTSARDGGWQNHHPGQILPLVARSPANQSSS